LYKLKREENNIKKSETTKKDIDSSEKTLTKMICSLIDGFGTIDPQHHTKLDQILPMLQNHLHVENHYRAFAVLCYVKLIYQLPNFKILFKKLVNSIVVNGLR
jgi:hypothetical protein